MKDRLISASCLFAVFAIIFSMIYLFVTGNVIPLLIVGVTLLAVLASIVLVTFVYISSLIIWSEMIFIFTGKR